MSPLQRCVLAYNGAYFKVNHATYESLSAWEVALDAAEEAGNPCVDGLQLAGDAAADVSRGLVTVRDWIRRWMCEDMVGGLHRYNLNA